MMERYGDLQTYMGLALSNYGRKKDIYILCIETVVTIPQLQCSELEAFLLSNVTARSAPCLWWRGARACFPSSSAECGACGRSVIGPRGHQAAKICSKQPFPPVDRA